MSRIIVGFLMAAFGFSFALKANWFYIEFGAVSFAEKYLGHSGGTRLFYKLLGVFLIFLGFLVITNLHEGFILWIISPLIPKQPEF